MRAEGGTATAELAAVYDASYRRLVGLIAAACGDRHEAEEVVQDAFVRLIGQWSSVSRYDNPEAWLRKVALGLLSNRRRKCRNGVRALVRADRPTSVPPPGAEAVDLERALAALPAQQRIVVLLVHVVGLDLESAARELGVPTGTVKSRLSRARSALQPLLTEELTDHA